MKKSNKNLLNKKLFKFIKSYSNNKHTLKVMLQKKDIMQTFDLSSDKSLKIFNIAYFDNTKKSIVFNNLKKNLVLTNSKFFFFYDILNFLRFNLRLVFNNSGVLKNKKISYEFLRNSYISYFNNSFNSLYTSLVDKVLMKKRRIHKRKNFIKLLKSNKVKKFLKLLIMDLKKKNWSIVFKYFMRYLYGLKKQYDFNSILDFLNQNLNEKLIWSNLIKDLESIYINHKILTKVVKKSYLRKFILKFFNKGLKIRKKRFVIIRFFKYFKKSNKGNLVKLPLKFRLNILNKKCLIETKEIYLNRKKKLKLKNAIKRKENLNKLLGNFYFNYKDQDKIFENKKVDYFYNKDVNLNKGNIFFTIVKNKINLTKYRWKLKEYFFLYNLDNFSLNFFNVNLQKYLKSYYSWFILIKNKIVLIKFYLLKYLNLYNYVLKLKKKYKFTSKLVNIQLINYKNLYKRILQSLKYYNNFLLVVLNSKMRLYNFNSYKKVIFSSFILNLFDKSAEKNTNTLNKYFINRFKNSEMIAYFLRDRVFNNININKFSLNNTFFFNTLVKINKSFKKKRKESLAYALTEDNAFFFFNNKLKKNYKVLFILHYFSFVSIFFYKYKLYIQNFFYNIKNKTINILKNKKNIDKFFIQNENIKNFNNIKELLVNSKNILVNYFKINYLKIVVKSYILLNALKNKIYILVYINNLFKKNLIKFWINYFLKMVLIILINKFSLLKFYIYFYSLIKKSKIKKLNSLIKFINKKENLIFKNRFIFNNFLNKLLKNNLYTFNKSYNFYVNLSKNDIYSKYAYRNLGNKRKCILHYKEKRTNIFLVLSNFKTKKVLGHVSGGQGLDRDYENSKRQKKGTRSITRILEKKFKPIVKLNKLKTVYVLAEGIWNFRLKHILKFWVLRYKLGIRFCRGLKVCYKLPHHRGLRKSNKKR